MQLRTRIERRDPRSLRRLERNARYMTYPQFRRLVDNIARDGCLTSVPLVYAPESEPDEPETVYSGNHRVAAAIEAGLTEIDVMLVLDKQSRDELIARQLSHNAIAGQDDPATLKELYEEIDHVDWREYAGLDDKTLELLEKVDLEGLGEANLDFTTVQIVFLPHEVERVAAAFEEAKRIANADERWLLSMAAYKPFMEAMATSHDTTLGKNQAVALMTIIGIFEQNLDGLRDIWYDAETGLPKMGSVVPLEAVFGQRRMPADSASVLCQAIDEARKRGDITEKGGPWQLLEVLAAEYLAGA